MLGCTARIFVSASFHLFATETIIRHTTITSGYDVQEQGQPIC